MILYISIISILLILLYHVLVKPHLFWKRRGIPQPTFWGIITDYFYSIIGIESVPTKLNRIYQRFPNSRYYGLYEYGLPLLLIKDLELIKDITIKYIDHFYDHRAFGGSGTDGYWSKTLVALKGERWRNMRLALSPTFTGSKMRVMFDLVDQTAQKYVDYYLANSEDLVELEVRESVCRYATGVIASCGFGLETDSIANPNDEFSINTEKANNFVSFKSTMKIILSLSFPKITNFLKMDLIDSKVTQFFKNVTLNVIKLRKEKNIYRPDMVHLLMEARKQHEEGNEKAIKLTDEDIVAQVMAFVIGGFETFASTLTHTIFELALYPDVQKKLQEEIDESLKESNGKLSYDLLKEMKYLDMVVSEALRKWTGGTQFDRVCTKEFTIKPEQEGEKEVTLQEGEVALINVFGIHHDPRYFPEPDRFDPERFNDTNKKNMHPYAYMPFGLGLRNCLGNRFALMEFKAILVRLLSKFDVVVIDKTEIPLQYNRSNLLIRPKNGIWMGYKKRNV